MKTLILTVISFFFISPFVASVMMQSNTIVIATGGDLQAKLQSVNCGDVISLQSRGVYTAPPDGFKLIKNCAGNPITITTNATLPAGRLNPATSGRLLAKLTSTSQGPPVLTIAPGAQGYRFTGIEITTDGRGYAPDLVNLGAYFTREQRLTTGKIVFDRVFVHPAEVNADNLFPSTVERSSGRGIAIGVADVQAVDSYIAGFAGKYPASNPNAGQNIDSYGIYSDAGPGPIKLVNNYISAQFNNVFIGGAGLTTTNTATISAAAATSVTLNQVANLNVGDLFAMSRSACVPTSTNPNAKPWLVGKVTGISGSTVSYTPVTAQMSCTPGIPDVGGVARWSGDHIRNIEVQGNYLDKPDAWNAFSSPKAWVEVKECVGCIVDGNDMYSGVGTAIAFTVRNQDGASPWATIENLRFTNNRMRGYKWGNSLLLTDNEQPSATASRILIQNNLWERPLLDPNSAAHFLQLVGGNDVSVIHNTIVQPGNPVVTDGRSVTNFVFRDNITANYQYGMQCYLGTAQACWPNAQVAGNVIIDTRWDKGDGPLSNRYPAGNYFPELNQVGFVEGTLLLSATSAYKGKASDGTDPGVDIQALLAALGGTVQPSPTVSPTPSPMPTPTPTPTVTPTPSPLPSPSPVASPTPEVREVCEENWPRNNEERSRVWSELVQRGCEGCVISDGKVRCWKVRQ